MKRLPSEQLNRARKLFENGNPDAAISTIQSIRQHLKNPDALYLLALCHATRNDYPQAETLFIKAKGLGAPSEILYGNIGLSQLHQGKINQSIKSFHAALDLNPAYYDAIKNLAIAYDHINDRSKAKKYVELANRINIDDPATINIAAKLSLYDDDPIRSISLYTRSLELQPRQPYIYTLLANSHVVAKQYDAAEQVLQRLEKSTPGEPFPINSLAHFYETRNRYKEAIDKYETVLRFQPGNPVAIAGMLRCRIASEDFDAVDKLLAQVEKSHPDSFEVNTERCNYYILIKNYESAYGVSKRILSNLQQGIPAPVNIALAHSISCQHTERLDEAKALLFSIIQNPTTTNEALEPLHFSLADILDKEKQFDNAFKHYRLANEIIPRQSDITYYEDVLTDIARTVDRGFLDSLPGSGNLSTTPVFIVGMPRSGTSLVEQILASHNEVYGAGELTDLWSIGNAISGAMNLSDYTKNFSQISQEDLKQFADTYIRKLNSISDGSPRVTDKLPHNFMHIGLIERLFPNAKIIHCHRHPFDTCLSIYFKKFNDNHVYARNLEELARFYTKYISLMEHWYENSSLSIITVNYEDMVNDQEKESRRLFEHIETEWNDDALRFYESNRIIMTPSSHQASRPIYKGSVSRWKNYINFIQPLEKILGDPNNYQV